MTYFLIAATIVSAVAALYDWRTGRVPNWLTIGALVAGTVAHFLRGYAYGQSEKWEIGGIQAASSIAGAIFCALAPALMFWKGAMGGGDVKLFAAIGALCHPLGGIETETYAFVTAALVAPARLAYQGVLLRTLSNSLALLINPMRAREKRKEVPTEMLTWFRLGPCIFIGSLLTLLSHWELP